ncbi:MAG: imidazole glycerol phosphate synthase subunit HisH [Gloeobacteraceae cyanobacterium ES-bin-144]|nr:imidazole glycerol phosphate synthase subunit HisH [Verrucomicrobiales bacterium]
MKIGIIDYGGGNLRSVANALRALGQEPIIIGSPSEVADATHIILPGQGAFGDTMERLDARDMVSFLKNWMAEDKPYFGICVGYQILFDGSEEAPGIDGLGIVSGMVRRFVDEPGLKIPHMGWNSAVSKRGESPVWKSLGVEPYFYYVHSYFPAPNDPQVIVSETTYGTQVFAAAVEQGNLFACQFHPEKSQEAGIQLIRNFMGI